MVQKLTQDEVISRFNEAPHSNEYDYSLVEYKNSRTKVKIVCRVHGVFEQRPSDHMRGFGCQQCHFRSQILTDKIFAERSRLVHGDYYGYDLVVYIRNDIKVRIICPLHGIFTQRPYSHIQGHGCRACFAWAMTLEEDAYLRQASTIHHSKYTYDMTNYVNAKSFITITCLKHGEFIQKAGNHYHGAGCPKCSHVISKKETAWLDSLNIAPGYRNKVIFIDGKRHNFDALDTSTNTIYEFYGDYWHGNPKSFDPNELNPSNSKTFGQLYDRTLQRESLLTKVGYKVISIWEYDFDMKGK